MFRTAGGFRVYIGLCEPLSTALLTQPRNLNQPQRTATYTTCPSCAHTCRPVPRPPPAAQSHCRNPTASQVQDPVSPPLPLHTANPHAHTCRPWYLVHNQAHKAIHVRLQRQPTSAIWGLLLRLPCPTAIGLNPPRTCQPPAPRPPPAAHTPSATAYVCYLKPPIPLLYPFTQPHPTHTCRPPAPRPPPGAQSRPRTPSTTASRLLLAPGGCAGWHAAPAQRQTRRGR